ncbi:6767_t:CDS:2, partial [Acaulospora colombiana]
LITNYYLGFGDGAAFAIRRPDCVTLDEGSNLGLVLGSYEQIGSIGIATKPSLDGKTGVNGTSLILPTKEFTNHFTNKESISISIPQEVCFNSYGYFSNMESNSDVITLATFKGLVNAAIIKCNIGTGNVILCGIDPFSSTADSRETVGQDNEHAMRKQFIRSLLTILGIMSTDILIPNLSKEIYLVALRPAIKDLLLHNIKKLEESDGMIKAGHNSFRAVESSSYEYKEDCVNDPDPQALKIVVGDELPPSSKTPCFNFERYFHELSNARSSTDTFKFHNFEFGSLVLYGEVLESTQALLEKNIKFTQQLPGGFVTLATQQTQGYGRGGNTWISPPGCLQFSFVMRHSVNNQSASVVFIQYLLSLSVVEAVRTKPGYEDVPLRLKWPNDIYAEIFNDPSASPELVKIGGVLVKSEFFKNEFLLISGCGVNLSNAAPTTSINQIIDKYNESHHTSRQLKPFSQEELLARILVKFELFYTEFCGNGSGYESFLDVYYERWLHSDQVVTLENHENRRARIIGIDNFGFLRAFILDSNEVVTLQPDGNRFDIMKGMI